jgi:hypothetical protein
MTSRSTTKNSKKDLSYIIPVEQQNTKLINAILIVKPNLKTVCFMIYRHGVSIGFQCKFWQLVMLAGAQNMNRL